MTAGSCHNTRNATTHACNSKTAFGAKGLTHQVNGLSAGLVASPVVGNVVATFSAAEGSSGGDAPGWPAARFSTAGASDNAGACGAAEPCADIVDDRCQSAL